MILKENQRINVVVRGLVFSGDHLLVTQWICEEKSYAFPIGGRVEFDEPVVESLRREVREELGAEITRYRLLYFAESMYESGGTDCHEYGWYFHAEIDREVCRVGEVIPNPDGPDLVIHYLKVDGDGLGNFWPLFLREYLPADFAGGFAQNPRYIFSRNIDGHDSAEIREMGWTFP